MPTTPFRILLIEDNEQDRELFRESLERFEDFTYGFHEGVTGKNAAALCRDFGPDCVLLDYSLPHSDGLGVLAELRGPEGDLLYPCVMVTGQGNERIAVQALRQGAQDYLVKDQITPESLHRAVHNAHERFHLQRSLREKTNALERPVGQLKNLQAVTAELSAGLHRNDVAQILAEQGVTTLGAHAALVLESGPRTEPRLLAAAGSAASLGETESPASPRDLPGARSLGGRPEFFESRDALAEAYPAAVAGSAFRETASLVSLPLRSGPFVAGALVLAYSFPRSFGGDDGAFYQLLAQQCALNFERARLFDEESTRKDQLSEALALREEFLSVASHELNTPLTAINLQLQMARRQVDPSAQREPDRTKQAAHLDAALRQVDRLGDFIRALLDVTRIRAGKLQLKREPVRLDELVGESAENFLEGLRKAGNTLHLDLEEASVLGDALRLEQVLNNLFGNAIKYAPGTAIHLTLKREGDTVVLIFRDDGPGIDEDRLPYIFDRFERAHTAGTAAGLGLGLYISRQLIEAQDGSIRAESEANRGTTFTVRLPSAA